jgi:hypothetical protein
VFHPADREQPLPLVTDPELRPLDLTVAPNGHILVASVFPFRAPKAVVTVREYDPAAGNLVRVFVPNRSVNFRQPRGLSEAETIACIAPVRPTWSRLTSRPAQLPRGGGSPQPTDCCAPQDRAAEA